MDASDNFPALLALQASRKFAKPRTTMKRKGDSTKVDVALVPKSFPSHATSHFTIASLDTENSKHSSSSLEDDDLAVASVSVARQKRNPLLELDQKKKGPRVASKRASPANNSPDIAESELVNSVPSKRFRSSSSSEAEDTCTLDCNLRVDSGNQAQTSNQGCQVSFSLHWGVRGRRKFCTRVTSPPNSEVDLKSKLCPDGQHSPSTSRPCTPHNDDVSSLHRKPDHCTYSHPDGSERLKNSFSTSSLKTISEGERNLRGSSSSETSNVKALVVSLTRSEICEDFKSLGVRLLQKPRNRRPKKIEKILQPLMLCSRLLNPSLTAETLLQEYNPIDEKKIHKHQASGLKAIARNEALKRFNKKFPPL